MAYVISRLCQNCLDLACVDVCPVECIYELVGPTDAEHPRQLYIHPTECINCSACEPECPWGAIYEDQELPPSLAEDAVINAAAEREVSRFQVAKIARDELGRIVHKTRPTADQVAANKKRWGL